MEARKSKLKMFVDLIFSEGPFIIENDFFFHATLSSRGETQSFPPVGVDRVA